MFDLFSKMDFISYKSVIPSSSLWVIGLIPLLVLLHIIGGWSNIFLCAEALMGGLTRLLMTSLTSSLYISNLIFISVFSFILVVNIWGLFPGLFGVSCQMTFIVFLSGILWVSMKSSSISKNLMGYSAHLTPSGSPVLLVPLLNLMEVVSNLMRPLTLTLRLCMNMTTGHILLNLMNFSLTFLVFGGLGMFLILLLVISFYYLFEVMICLIQASVYTLLISQYMEEHTS